VYKQKDNNYNGYTTSGVEPINKKHCCAGYDCTGKRRLPAEEVKRWPEVGRRTNFEKESGEVHDEESHLNDVSYM
jgi:hypothetical protein